MVLWPVLYTDTTDAWKLVSKRQRLAISGAGIGAELIIAAYATFAWTFLPDGALQSAAFLVATTTWVISILVNLNPFMRFDGYFLFSDLLEVENLQERAFALARWRLRECLVGFGDPPPESWPRGKRTILLLYAYLTWAYRAMLFIGIALLIYHFLFKLAGLLVFSLEIVLLIGLPVFREVKQYVQRAGDLSVNRQIVTSVAVIAVLAAGVATPWATPVTVPSLLRPSTHTVVYAPLTALIETIAVAQGGRVTVGAPLATLRSQDLDNAIEIARAQVAVLERRLAFEGFDSAQRQNRLVVASKLRATRAGLTGLLQQRTDLSIAAPIGGTIVEIPEDTRSGGWIAEGEPLMLIAESTQAVIEAYIPEGTVKRIEIGATATFYPENLDDPPLTGIVESIDPAAVTVLDSAYLASKFGGGISVVDTDTGKLVPQASHYRARISIAGTGMSLARITRGSAVIAAENTSLAEKAWKSVLGVIIRESGF
jgi:putative peptide zinc metalloprotease protein